VFWCSVFSNPILGLCAQTFGNPVDVVEVGNHLDTAGNPLIVETVGAEYRYIVSLDNRRLTGQLLGVLEKGLGGWTESRGSPVGGEPVDHVLIFDLIPEVVEMSECSVVAHSFMSEVTTAIISRWARVSGEGPNMIDE